MPSIYVDINLDDFDDDDLIEEMESCGLNTEFSESELSQSITTIYQKRRLGQDYESDLDQLIYQAIGKVI
jgi:hypothetical protein